MVERERVAVEHGRTRIQRHSPRVGEEEIEGPDVQRRASPVSPDVAAILALQRSAGNHAVCGLYAVQRKMHDRYTRQWTDAVALGTITDDEVRLLRAHVTDHDPKDEILSVVSLSNWFTKAFKDKDRKRRIQALLWQHLARNGFDVGGARRLRDLLVSKETKELGTQVAETRQAVAIRQMGGVVYGDPPLSEQAGRRILAQIAAGPGLTGGPDPLAGLKGSVPSYGGFETFDAPAEHEWGLGRAPGGEHLIIVGDRGGVTWGPYLQQGLVPVAHSHPYFADRHPKRTKVIAGDGTLPIQTIDAGVNLEVLKTFPSAGDVEFCANHRYAHHTVYVPYVYVDSPVPAIANPTPQRAHLPRVSFDIVNAVATADKVYECGLVMYADGQVIWQKDRVRADTSVGGGGGGTLKW